MCTIFLNIFVLLYPVGMLCGAEMSPLYKLHKTVREGYDPHIRPIKDPRMATTVTADFVLFSVEEVNEASETFTSFGKFNITWYDEWLVWNISDHANIRKIYMDLHNVWTPDLMVSNSIENYRMMSDTKGLVSVTNTGFITWQRTMRQTTKCSMDMSKFPIDKQTCSLRLDQWESDKNEMILQGGSVRSNYNPFQIQGEWMEIEKSIETKTIYPGDISRNVIWFTFTFQRKPLHVVITSALPVFLLSVLNLGVFLLPPESGEKISLCISVFLSYALILTDINEDLPHSLASLAVFRVYLLTMLLVKVITIWATIMVLKRYHTEIGVLQLSSASSQEGGESSVLGESKERCYNRTLSAGALNRVCFAVISLIMIVTTSICVVFSLF